MAGDTTDPDIIVRNAYVYDRDDVVDIAIKDGEISEISEEIPGSGRREFDAEGNLACSGFFEGHLHMDKAFVAAGERFPKFNDEPTDLDWVVQKNAEYYGNASKDEIASNAKQVARMAVSNGILHMRGQTYVGESAGTKAVEALLAVRDELADAVDIEVVAFPQSGISHANNRQLVDEGVKLGADMVGGLDPAARNNNVERTIGTWFDLATEHDVDLDVHIHEPDSLGIYTLRRLAEKTIQHEYQGRVTASHSYALADVNTGVGDEERFSEGRLASAIPRFQEAGLKFVTCFRTTRPSMPIRRFADAGLPIGIGSDNVKDYTSASANADMLEGGMIEAFKLNHDGGYLLNPGLERIWNMLTEASAGVFDIHDDYGIEVGNTANIVVLDSPSPQWAILEQADTRHVIKAGEVVIEDTEFTDQFEAVFE